MTVRKQENSLCDGARARSNFARRLPSADMVMRALNTVHDDAAEGDIMHLSLSERCKSKVDGELELIGIKVAAHFAEKPRYTPGKTAQ